MSTDGTLRPGAHDKVLCLDSERTGFIDLALRPTGFLSAGSRTRQIFERFVNTLHLLDIKLEDILLIVIGKTAGRKTSFAAIFQTQDHGRAPASAVCTKSAFNRLGLKGVAQLATDTTEAEQVGLELLFPLKRCIPPFGKIAHFDQRLFGDRADGPRAKRHTFRHINNVDTPLGPPQHHTPSGLPGGVGRLLDFVETDVFSQVAGIASIAKVVILLRRSG